MKNFGFQKMDEMEQQITLRACRAAWVFLVLALFIWEVWELIPGRGHQPARLPVGNPGGDLLPGPVARPGPGGG